jgi:hypothetical protein
VYFIQVDHHRQRIGCFDIEYAVAGLYIELKEEEIKHVSSFVNLSERRQMEEY